MHVPITAAVRSILCLLVCSSSAGPRITWALSSSLALTRAGDRYLGDAATASQDTVLDNTEFDEVDEDGAGTPRTAIELQLQRTARVADYLARDAEMLGQELHSLETSLHGAPRHRHGHRSSAGVREAARTRQVAPAPLAAKAAGLTQLDERWLAEQAKFAAELRDSDPTGASRTLLPETTALLSLEKSHAAPSPEPATEVTAGEEAAEEGAGPSELREVAHKSITKAAPLEPDEVTPEPAPAPESPAPESMEEDAPLVENTKSSSDGDELVDVEHNPFMAVFTWGYHFSIFWSVIHWSVLIFLSLLFCWCCHLCGRSRDSHGRAMASHAT